MCLSWCLYCTALLHFCLQVRAADAEDVTEREVVCEHVELGDKHFAHGMCRACFQEFLAVSGGIWTDGAADPPAFTKGKKKRVLALPAPDAANGAGVDFDEQLRIQEMQEMDNALAVFRDQSTSQQAAVEPAIASTSVAAAAAAQQPEPAFGASLQGYGSAIQLRPRQARTKADLVAKVGGKRSRDDSQPDKQPSQDTGQIATPAQRITRSSSHQQQHTQQPSSDTQTQQQSADTQQQQGPKRSKRARKNAAERQQTATAATAPGAATVSYDNDEGDYSAKTVEQLAELGLTSETGALIALPEGLLTEVEPGGGEEGEEDDNEEMTDDLSDLDDDEIAAYINTNQEAKLKEVIAKHRESWSLVLACPGKLGLISRLLVSRLMRCATCQLLWKSLTGPL